MYHTDFADFGGITPSDADRTVGVIGVVSVGDLKFLYIFSEILFFVFYMLSFKKFSQKIENTYTNYTFFCAALFLYHTVSRRFFYKKTLR